MLYVVIVFVGVAAENLGLPLPGQSLLVTALAVRHHTDTSGWLIAGTAAAGGVVGDTAGYVTGRKFGDRIIAEASQRFPRLIPASGVKRARTVVNRYGTAGVAIGRWFPVLRIFVAPTAGALRLPYRAFLPASIVGSAVWTAVVFGAVTIAGRTAREGIHGATWIALGVAVAVAVSATVARFRSPHVQDLQTPTAAGDPVPWRRVGAVVARRAWSACTEYPFTVAFTVGFVTIGVVTGALWHAIDSRPDFVSLAYGAPNFAEGRWWTLVTGSLVAAEPLHYSLFLLICPAALWAYERRAGTGKAVIVFTAGQLGAVLITAALLTALAGTGWVWPRAVAGDLDVGPSAGYLAVLVGVFWRAPQPWRLRGLTAVGAIVTVFLLFSGTVADVEHFVAVAGAFVFLKRPGLAVGSLHERRLFAFAGALMLAAVPLLTAIGPEVGPFEVSFDGLGTWIFVGVDIAVAGLLTFPLHRGQRAAWRIMVPLGVCNVAVGVSSLAFTSDEAIATIIRLPTAYAGLWLVATVLLVFSRDAFAVTRRKVGREVAVGRDDAVRALQQWGGESLSWMITWPHMEYLRVRESIIGFQRHRPVALILGDPIGPVAGAESVMEDIDRQARRLGLTPCFFAASEATRHSAPQGWASLRIAEDEVVDLDDVAFTGKKWQPIRSAVNRAGRERVTLRMVTLEDEPVDVLEQVRSISDGWVGDKELPEMAFTLGGVAQALDRHVQVALAVDAAEIVQAVLSWLPVYGEGGSIRGWTLDVMRRRDGAMPGVMEFLIAASARFFHDSGAEFVSLSAAPLAPGGADVEKPERTVLDLLARVLQPVYATGSLESFKRKFNPVGAPLFLVYRDAADLPGIAVALTRAYLPGVTALQLSRAGIAAIRR
ncbi:SNARE associated Golgi protein [Frondihabitans australicus]|uniref:SNARE associated Golgi protein n=1 Tax=Frondihabitans australicus TaxID=386892 RepID=A0A495IKP1_9MICO|nr:SNARE associated Golgi protein [Frondihabitans australicus]